jgi:predicted nucleic acid-binding protein
LTAWILDASVAAKWVLPATDEPLAAEAKAVRDQYSRGDVGLIVPDLFWPEIGNLLRTATLRGRITPEHARLGLEHMLSFGLRTVPSTEMIADALAIAQAYSRTVYDSIYVALALATNRTLLTSDQRLANALGGVLPVRWLGAI